jgi:DNA-binding MarR family transcriptional regulator
VVTPDPHPTDPNLGLSDRSTRASEHHSVGRGAPRTDDCDDVLHQQPSTLVLDVKDNVHQARLFGALSPQRGHQVAPKKTRSATEASPPTVRDASFDLKAQQVFDSWRELRRVSMRSLYEEVYGLGDDALEPAQFDALEILLTTTEWRMVDFAKALHVDPSTATRMIDRLVKAGVAVRGPSGVDGRGIVVRATRDGRKRRSSITVRRLELMREFLRFFEDDEVDQLIELMGRLADSVLRVADERSSADRATESGSKKRKSAKTVARQTS